MAGDKAVQRGVRGGHREVVRMSTMELSSIHSYSKGQRHQKRALLALFRVIRCSIAPNFLPEDEESMKNRRLRPGEGSIERRAAAIEQKGGTESSGRFK